MNFDNPRVNRTKGYLKQALIELLKTTSFEKITIKAICEKAAVNRSTFYAYYSCPRDLIEEIEDDILMQLPEYSSSTRRPFIETFRPFIEYIRENGDTFRILLSSSADTSFGEQLVSAVMDKYDEFANLTDQEDKEMIFLVVSRREVAQVERKIKEIDPRAFVVVTNAYDTYGEGFKPFPDKDSILNS